MTNTEIKEFNNSNIRTKTQSKSVTTDNVADALDNLVDYIDENAIPGPSGPQGPAGPQGSPAVKDYKSYVAYLSYNSGTGFVVQSTVVFNDLIGTPLWSVDGGNPIFNATLTNGFTLNKTVMFTDTQVKGQGSFISANKNVNSNVISFQLTDSSGDLFFSPFSNLLVEIRVYN